MTLFKYRIFVVVTFLVLLFSMSLDQLWQKDLVEFVSEFAVSLQDVGSVRISFLKMLFVVMFAVAVYSFVGLLKLQNHARFVFLALFAFIVPMYLLLGVSVQSGLSRIFYDLGLLLSGVLIALCFTQPVKYYFRD